MSIENVEAILTRATREPEFRQLLLKQPVAALAGYQLTDDEIAALSGLIHENFDAHSARLEQRLSQSAPSLNSRLSDLSSAAGNTPSTLDTTIF